MPVAAFDPHAADRSLSSATSGRSTPSRHDSHASGRSTPPHDAPPAASERSTSPRNVSPAASERISPAPTPPASDDSYGSDTLQVPLIARAALPPTALAPPMAPRPRLGVVHGFSRPEAVKLAVASGGLFGAHLAVTLVELLQPDPTRTVGALAPLHAFGIGSGVALTIEFALLAAFLRRAQDSGGDFSPLAEDARGLDLEAGGDGSDAASAAYVARLGERRVALWALKTSVATLGAGVGAYVAFAPQFARPCGPAEDPGAAYCRSHALLATGVALAVIAGVNAIANYVYTNAATTLLGVQMRAAHAP